MLRVLLPKASDPNPAVAASVIMCLGELACVGGEDVMPHVPDLMQVIIAKLTDSSIVKRDAALHTLGQVCSNTGYVIQPLVDHPQLLQILSRILKTEPTQSVRREVVKVLGILGALDPYRRKVCHESVCICVPNSHHSSSRLNPLMNWKPLPPRSQRRSVTLAPPVRMIITRRWSSTLSWEY
jgi:phosphatidylinositol kinase/protein kinase (PI-3  family)